MQIRASRFLRWVLVADSGTCVGTGLLLMFGTFLAQFLAMPAELLRYAGISLLPFAASLVYRARRESLLPAVV